MTGVCTGRTQSEASFQRAVVELAELCRWRVYWTHDSRRSPKGYPDLTLVRDRVVWAELKTGRGRPTVEQLGWLASIRAAGGEAYLWRPECWPEIEQVLTGQLEVGAA
jgi:hypothetical protein